MREITMNKIKESNLEFIIYVIILLFVVFHLSSWVDVNNYCKKISLLNSKSYIVKADWVGPTCWFVTNNSLTSVDQEIQLLREKK